MADLIDELNAFEAAHPEFMANIEKWKTALQGAADGAGKLGGGLSSIITATQTFDSGNMAGKLKALGIDFSDITKLVGNFTESLGDIGIKAALFVEPLVNVLPRPTNLFGELGSAAKQAGVDLTESTTAMQNALSRISPFLGKFAGTILESANQTQNLELNMMNTAAGAGEFNKLIAAAGPNLENMRDLLSNYTSKIETSAGSTGKLSTAVAMWADQLRRVPGALDEQIKMGGENNQTLSMLTATIQVASGTGMQQKDVVDLLSFAYRQLGTTGQGALEFVSQMAIVAQDLNMPLDIMTRTTQRAAESFKLFGDNTRSTIDITKQFSSALKDSALGPEAIAGLVDQVTGGINKMDIAHKAFVSSRSGGPGGVAGAFEIDLLLQQGKLDQVFEMVKKSMQQSFGGPVVTLNDVGKNPAMANELLKQVSYLKQVAGIAGNDQEAYRILEVMKKGGSAEGAITRKPEDALKTALETGNKIQVSQTNELIKIQNEMLRVTRAQAFNNAELVRVLGGNRVDIEMEMNKSKAKEAEGGGGGYTKSAFTPEGQMAPGFLGVADRLAPENMRKTVEGIGTSVENMGGQLKSELSPAMQAISEKATQEYNKIRTQINNFVTGKKEVPEELKAKQKELEGTFKELGITPPETPTAPTTTTTARPLTTALGLAPPGPRIAPLPTASLSPARALMPAPLTRTQAAPGDQAHTRQAGQAPLNATAHVTVDIKDGVATIARKEAQAVFEENVGKGFTQTGR